MGMAAKVLWGEGLFLRPQHFQRQDQYHEARLHHTASALHPYLWGVAHLQWDLAALQTGTLRLLALSAIFRDGEVFEALGDGAPGSDALPPPVDLEALPPAVQEVTYYAALPILNREGMNYTAQESKAGTPAATRFAHAMRATPDLFTESAVAPFSALEYAGKRLYTDCYEPRPACWQALAGQGAKPWPVRYSIKRATPSSASSQNRRRATNSASAPSSHPAVRIFSALFPHFGHCSNHSPGLNASLCGATVFVQPHVSHSKVKGLGLIGISTLLGTYANSLPSVLSTTGIRLLDQLIKCATYPAVVARHALKILRHFHDHLA